MRRSSLFLFAALLVGIPSAARADSTCGTGKSWAFGVGCTSEATGEVLTNGGASDDALDVEFCTTNAQLVSPLTAGTSYLPGAKALYIENRSSATCYVGFDAQNVTTTGGGATGYKFAPGTERAFDVSGTIFGPKVRVACTTALTTPACLFLGWLK